MSESMQEFEGNGEKRLLHRTAAGDQAAFTQLFDSYHHSLGAFVFGITKSRELAEEVVLDIFLKIWITREVLAEVQNFKAYLFTLSRNAAISALRKLIREREQRSGWLSDQQLTAEEDPGEKEAYLNLVDEAINQLSPQRKKIYLLSREQGLKYEEIATLTGISRFTVRAHIQQAVAFLGEYLKSRMAQLLLLAVMLVNFLKK